MFTRRAYFVTHLSFCVFHVFLQAVSDIVDFACYILSLAGFAMTAKSDGFTEERLHCIGDHGNDVGILLHPLKLDNPRMPKSFEHLWKDRIKLKRTRVRSD